MRKRQHNKLQIFWFSSFLSNIPQQFNPLSPPWRLPSCSLFSCFFSPVSYACLATLRVEFLKYWCFSTLTCSVCVAEVTQVNSISVSPTPAKRGALHEVSSVKVPRPASPFITHETRRYVGRWRLLYLVAKVEIGKYIVECIALWFDSFVLTIIFSVLTNYRRI